MPYNRHHDPISKACLLVAQVPGQDEDSDGFRARDCPGQDIRGGLLQHYQGYAMELIETVEQLEERLSRPTEGALATLRALEGDVLVLGAGGKMGPTLARMVRRGVEALSQKRRVLAVSRFSSPGAAAELRGHGVETLSCDLTDRDAVRDLPDAPNVIFMAGQKFGTQDAPGLTWVMNTLVPAVVAERYARSRIVVFSTGCVYALSPATGGGSREVDPLEPPGEYANSCVGRERIFTHFSQQSGTAALLFRLNYAIDLRYGVLLDVAQKVAQGTPVDVTVGYANVIWQGDASARAIQCLEHVSSPPLALERHRPRDDFHPLARRAVRRVARAQTRDRRAGSSDGLAGRCLALVRVVGAADGRARGNGCRHGPLGKTRRRDPRQTHSLRFPRWKILNFATLCGTASPSRRIRWR